MSQDGATALQPGNRAGFHLKKKKEKEKKLSLVLKRQKKENQTSKPILLMIFFPLDLSITNRSTLLCPTIKENFLTFLCLSKFLPHVF